MVVEHKYLHGRINKRWQNRSKVDFKNPYTDIRGTKHERLEKGLSDGGR